jgi:8-oxo-dGTP pyrophosphatase MutT (NUDIX family)
MPVEKSAGVIVFYIEENGEIKFLFLKHKPDFLDFPKGLIEKGEKIEKAALRECKEETGLEITELVPGFKETIRFFFKAKFEYQKKRGLEMGQTVLKFVTYFLAQSKTKEVNISFEHEGYEWLTLEQAKKRMKKRKESKQMLEKANNVILSKKYSI